MNYYKDCSDHYHPMFFDVYNYVSKDCPSGSARDGYKSYDEILKTKSELPLTHSMVDSILTKMSSILKDSSLNFDISYSYSLAGVVTPNGTPILSYNYSFKIFSAGLLVKTFLGGVFIKYWTTKNSNDDYFGYVTLVSSDDSLHDDTEHYLSVARNVLSELESQACLPCCFK